MTHRRLTVSTCALFTVLVFVAFISGCGTTSAPQASPTPNATSAARTAACNGLATIDEGLASLATVGTNTTIGEVKAKQQKISETLTNISARMPEGTGTALDRLIAANAQLGTTLQGYPDSATIAQTSIKLQELQSKVASAQNASQNLGARLQCAP